MASIRLCSSVAVCVFWALAVFALNELEAMTLRAFHRIASTILIPVAWVMMRRPGWLV